MCVHHVMHQLMINSCSREFVIKYYLLITDSREGEGVLICTHSQYKMLNAAEPGIVGLLFVAAKRLCYHVDHTLTFPTDHSRIHLTNIESL